MNTGRLYNIVVVGILWLLALSTTSAYANGKFYYGDQIPRDVPYQQAILFHDGNTETLILQSTFHGVPADVAWVVPTPSLSEAAVLPKYEASRLFRRLGRWTAPEVISIDELILMSTLLFFLLVLLVRIIVSLVRYFRKIPQPPPRPRLIRIVKLVYKVGFIAMIVFGYFLPLFIWYLIFGYILIGILLIVLFSRRWLEIGGAIFVFMILLAIALPSYHDHGVEIYDQYEAGPYHVNIITAQSTDGIIQWLNEHEFSFTEQDKNAFHDYVEQGWFFITAKPNADSASKVMEGEALVRPLVLRFKTPEPIYPLALTSTTGGMTEILLYAYSSHRLTTNGRLTLDWAGKTHWLWSGKQPISEPIDLLPHNRNDFPYLTKFSGRLTPEQMRTDLVLRVNDNDEPYRPPKIYR